MYKKGESCQSCEKFSMNHSTDLNNVKAGWVKTEQKEIQHDILSLGGQSCVVVFQRSLYHL